MAQHFCQTSTAVTQTKAVLLLAWGALGFLKRERGSLLIVMSPFSEAQRWWSRAVTAGGEGVTARGSLGTP